MSERSKKPTKRGVVLGGMEDDAPTKIYQARRRDKQAAPPIKMISMKTPAGEAAEQPEAELPHVKLRAMSEVSRAQIPLNLGNLAPPYDPAQARARTLREYLLWGSLAVVLASAIALAVWFLAT